METTAEARTAHEDKEIHTGVTAAFIEVMDGLYWDGYATELKRHRPEAYRFELESFTALFRNTEP